jgi:hypothetical protein
MGVCIELLTLGQKRKKDALRAAEICYADPASMELIGV